MENEDFFEEPTEQSKIKARIVSKYFSTWAKVIISTRTQSNIAYIDLYAGPGRYKDGSESTPLLILEQAIKDQSIRRKLVTYYADKNPDFVQVLESEINKLPGINTLFHKPQVHHFEVGDDIVDTFKQMTLIPTLLFLDPWGYKGLSLELVNSVIKDWACECIFFFNFNRINAAVPNKTVQRHIDGLFGKVRADALRVRIKTLRAAKRESAIMGEVIEALKETYGKFVMTFRFKNEKGTRTSHYLVFVTKDFKGYSIMKDVMASESSSPDMEVPSFEYNPVRIIQPQLKGIARPLETLEKELLSTFAGRILTVEQMYEEHSVGTHYMMRNYKDVLKKLESENLISADPPSDKRRKGTLADWVKISFPKTGV